MRAAILFLMTAVLSAGTHLVPQQYSRIQKAVDAALPGDTVLISPGYYVENITLTKVLVLKNSSSTATVTMQDTSFTPAQGFSSPSVITINAAGAGVIRGLIIRGSNQSNVYDIGIRSLKDDWTITECTFRDLYGVYSVDVTTNIIRNVFRKISRASIAAGKNSRVIGNMIYGNREDGVIAGGNCFIANNLFTECSIAFRPLSVYDSITVRNNTFTTFGNIFSSNQYNIALGVDMVTMKIQNNIVAFNNGYGIGYSGGNGGTFDAFFIRNNNIYMNSQDYNMMTDATGTHGNISTDPFFCGNDSLLYLASDSPCIDSGVEEIIDIDGTRSDMGMYGGPFASALKYAPASFNITAPADQSVCHTNVDPYEKNPVAPFIIRWSSSFDRDGSGKLRYRVLLGRSVNTTICRTRTCTTPKIAEIIDTLYSDSTSLQLNAERYSPRQYYYSIEAVDEDGLVTRAVDIRSFTVIKDNTSARAFLLEQNYPNPFNASTSIRYGLPYDAVITITLFDILGREVMTLEKGPKLAGYHFAVVSSPLLSSGVYYYMLTMSSALIPFGGQLETDLPITRKMIVIK